MKISIAELVRLQKTAHEVEDSINENEALHDATTSAKAASVSNFFDSLVNGTDITIKA